MTRMGSDGGGGHSLRVIAAILAVGVSGCATIPPSLRPGEEYLKGHYILAHEDGYPISPDSSPFRAKLTLAEHKQSIEQEILAGIDRHARKLWSKLRDRGTVEEPPLRILLFVHGGLNGYKADFDRMRAMMARPADCAPGGQRVRLFVSQGCDNAKTTYYPIFVNWNSDLADSIRDDLFFIRFGDRRPELGWFTSPFVLAARLAESIFSAPNGWVANIRNFSDARPGVADWLEGVAMTPIRALTTPILKAFGTSAWQIMLRRADLLVAERLDDAPPEEAAPDKAQAVATARAAMPRREGAARTLVKLLGSRITWSSEGTALWRLGGSGEEDWRPPVEITLVGHSIGALVLNRIVASDHQLPIKRILYLAPAASVDEIDGFIWSHLLKNRDTNDRPSASLWTFTLNRQDEVRERDPSTLLPRGSLLVWIDSFFEPIGEPGDRRFGRYKSHLDYYGADGPPSYLNVCELSATSAHRAKRHGDIDNPPHLERALWRSGSETFQSGVAPPEDPIECTLK